VNRRARPFRSYRAPWSAALLAVLALTLTACGSGQTPAAGASSGSGSGVDKLDTFQQVAPDQAAAKQLPGRIKQAGKLVVVMNVSSPPAKFYASDNKTVIGLDADLARAIGRVLDTPVEIQDVQFDGIIPGLSAKRFDMAIADMSPTPERLQVLDMIHYGMWGSSLAIAKGNPLRLTAETLCGHKIAVQQGAIQATKRLPDLSKKHCESVGKPKIEAVVLPSQNDAVLQLASGRVDGVLADTPVLAYAAIQTPDKIELGSELNRSAVAIGLPKDSDLTAGVQAAVQALMNSGTYAKIFAKWGLAAAVTAKPVREVATP
jgi:polar amino acid transport system substrate-binding protein